MWGIVCFIIIVKRKLGAFENSKQKKNFHGEQINKIIRIDNANDRCSVFNWWIRELFTWIPSYLTFYIGMIIINSSLYIKSHITEQVNCWRFPTVHFIFSLFCKIRATITFIIKKETYNDEEKENWEKLLIMIIFFASSKWQSSFANSRRNKEWLIMWTWHCFFFIGLILMLPPIKSFLNRS